MTKIVAVLRSGDEVVFEDLPGPDGAQRRRRFEEEPDGYVSVYSDHVRTGSDGSEEVLDSIRLARFAPENLLGIASVDD